jgi:predicted HTH domain antitoxin
MSITLDLPADVERRLRKAIPNLDTEAREAVALDLFRKQIITHYELGQMLGLDRFQTDAFLKERQEFAQSLTLADVESDRQTIRDLLRETGR